MNDPLISVKTLNLKSKLIHWLEHKCTEEIVPLLESEVNSISSPDGFIDLLIYLCRIDNITLMDIALHRNDKSLYSGNDIEKCIRASRSEIMTRFLIEELKIKNKNYLFNDL